MNHLISLFSLFLSYLTIVSVSAQEAKSFSLAEAKSYAIVHSKDISLKQIEVEQASQKVKESLALLLPQVDASLDYTRYGKLPATIIPADAFFPGSEAAVVQFGVPNNLNAGINARQTVFNGVFLVGLKAADIFMDITQQEKEVKVDEVINNVTESYINALVARESVEIVARNIQNLETLLQQTQQLFKNGLVEEIDVDRLELSLANLNIQVKSLRNNCELTEIVLKFQMGYPLSDSIILTQNLEEFMDSIPVLYPEKATFDARKEVKLMDLRESINNANVKRLKSGYLPTVEAFAGLSTSAQRQNFSFLRFGNEYPWFNVRAMGFSVNVPIWDSFGKKAQISSAKLDIERIKLGRDLMLDGFQLEYDRARLNYAQAIDEYNNTLKNLELAKKIYRVAQIKYKEGIGSSLELTTAERELYSTQANVVNAMYKVVVSKVEINRVLGLN